MDSGINFGGNSTKPRTAKNRQEPAKNQAHKRTPQDAILQIAFRIKQSAANKTQSTKRHHPKTGGGGATPHGAFNQSSAAPSAHICK